MKKGIIFLLIFLIVPFVALAQTTTIEPSPQESPSVTGSVRQNLQERREDLQQKFEDRMKELQTRKEQLQEQFKAQRESFKEKLQTIRDLRKQQITEKVDKSLANINQRRTDHFNKILAKLNEILGRIQSKAAELKAAGKNTAALDAAITAASNAISTAQTAVSDQSAKDYAPTITTDNGLKNAVGTVFKQLQTDLAVTRQTVAKARDAVKTAALELRKLMPESTNSATESSSQNQ